ncbi:MAG: hypothetical protein ACREUN_11005 [Burkholderiales bacterium]
MAQFRVEFVLDQASGKYLAELYDPENQQELIVRTEALYPTQASAVLGLVQLFKDAVLKFPKPGTPPRKKAKRKKPAKKRAGRARTSARRTPRKRARR